MRMDSRNGPFADILLGSQFRWRAGYESIAGQHRRCRSPTHERHPVPGSRPAPGDQRRAGRDAAAGQAARAPDRLLLDANRTVSSDWLVDALWGESPPPSARNLLQVYVAQLRRALGRDAIETDPPGYAIKVAPEDLDAWRFERLLAEGRTALDDGNAQLAASLLRRALDHWRGPALDDVADEACHEEVLATAAAVAGPRPRHLRFG